MKQLGSDECGDSEYHRRCQHRLGGIRQLLTARAICLDLRKHCATDRGVYQRQNRYDSLELLFHTNWSPDAPISTKGPPQVFPLSTALRCNNTCGKQTSTPFGESYGLRSEMARLASWIF